jgi:hypothetical protein
LTTPAFLNMLITSSMGRVKSLNCSVDLDFAK